MKNRTFPTFGGAMMQLMGYTWEDGPRETRDPALVVFGIPVVVDERVPHGVVLLSDREQHLLGAIVYVGDPPTAATRLEQTAVDPDLLKWIEPIPPMPDPLRGSGFHLDNGQIVRDG